MSVEIATFEKVKEAVEFLQRQGKKPTVSAVHQLVAGGSRSTVLAHMQNLFNQIAGETPKSEMAETFLSKTAAAMVKTVWQQAQSMTAAEMEHRFKVLVDINTGIAEGIQDLIQQNEELQLRADRAEADLAKSREMEAHLTELSHFVNRLKRGLPPKPAMLQAIELVEQFPGMDRPELIRRMLSLGYPNRSAHQARKNVVADGYVEEKGDPAQLYLTANGEARLARERASAAEELAKGAA